MDLKRLEIKGGEVIFPVEVQDKQERWLLLWVRAVYSKNVPADLARIIHQPKN